MNKTDPSSTTEQIFDLLERLNEITFSEWEISLLACRQFIKRYNLPFYLTETDWLINFNVRCR